MNTLREREFINKFELQFGLSENGGSIRVNLRPKMLTKDM